MIKNNNTIITGKKHPKTRAHFKYKWRKYIQALEADLATEAHLEHNIWIQNVLSGLSENDLYTIAITKY
jgi:hypothetical protein